MTTGPDFLCVGLMKAGTGWLYDQLQEHPSFWMPPIKEFHYFDRAHPDPRNFRTLDKRRSSRSMSVENGWRPLTEADDAFFTLAAKAYQDPISLDQYAELFRFKADRLTGDITPAYSTLAQAQVDEIGERFTDTKCLLLLRDPIARLWSQISMNNRRGKVPAQALEEPQALIDYVSRPVIRKRSFPTEVAARWSAAFPGERFGLFFFDDIVGRPQELRAEVLRFLGGDPEARSALAPSFNRKADMHKLAMPPFARAALIDYFADELRACAERFGGPAVQWSRTYGLAG